MLQERVNNLREVADINDADLIDRTEGLGYQLYGTGIQDEMVIPKPFCFWYMLPFQVALIWPRVFL